MLAKNAHFLRARVVVPVAAPPIEDGGVVLRDGRIVAVGRFSEVRTVWPEGSVTDLGERLLLPGLINAHCHLDYTSLRGRIAPPPTFTHWIGSINAAKRDTSPADTLASILEGYRELRRWGTTTVFNLASLPQLLHELPEPPLRTYWAPELYDLREPASELLAKAIGSIADFQLTRPGSCLRFGISPHAPYTASPRLYQLCADAARQRGWLLSTHIAESPEEAAMFERGSGALHELLAGIGREMSDCGSGSTVFSSMARRGLSAPGWLLAHGNELEEADLALIAFTHEKAEPGAAPWTFVHCPRSHAYFQHRPFPWQRLADAGALIALGTDSLASNDSLSLFAEMRAARQAIPSLTPELLLKAVTQHAARALGAAGELGEITSGARADLIALPYTGHPRQSEEIYQTILEHDRPIDWQLIDGKIPPQ